MRIVIPSRQRSGNIPWMFQLFPAAYVCVADSEVETYRSVTPADRLLAHPDAVSGMGPIRHWILTNVQDETVMMIDDDVSKMWIVTGLRKRPVRDPVTIMAVLEHVAQCAKDAGAPIFGFNQAWDVRKYDPFRPFGLRTWTSAIFGVIGRSVLPNPQLKLRVDIDFCLRALARHKMIWVDYRFAFEQQRFSGTGGNASNRSEERNRAEIAYLKQRWGGAIGIRPTKASGVRIVLNV